MLQYLRILKSKYMYEVGNCKSQQKIFLKYMQFSRVKKRWQKKHDSAIKLIGM